ncbi:MAG TPA: DUF535 family protein [Methylophilaceae bacterium]|jgi:uncharacterized protein VirK/YbjX
MKSISKLGYGHLFPSTRQVTYRLRTSYFPKSWNTQQQLDALLTHYQLLKSLPKFLDVTHGQQNKILELNEYSKNLILSCALPKQLSPQGEVSLSLVKNDATLMSIPFTLGHSNNELVIYIWSIEKVSVDMSSLFPIYKDFSGLRTQDLMMEMICLLAKKIGAHKIMAIADESRRHQIRSSFSYLRKNHLEFSYDELWLHHHGVKVTNEFYEIPHERHSVIADTAPVNKREMLAKRYLILSKISKTFDTLQYYIHFSLITKLITEVMSGLTFFYNVYDSFQGSI